MSTPELWAYVDLSWTSSRISAYMVRAGTVNMVLECTQRPWRQKKNLARDCFCRSCAANILTAMPELTRESPRRLSMLHLNRQSTEEFLESSKSFPALVELSITNGVVKSQVKAQFPSLTRLHMHWLHTDISSTSIIDLLQHSPRIMELELDGSTPFSAASSQTPDRQLALPHLHKLAFIGAPGMMYDILTALTLDTRQLRHLSIEPFLVSSRERPLFDMEWLLPAICTR
jgi:hypothetical protein